MSQFIGLALGESETVDIDVMSECLDENLTVDGVDLSLSGLDVSSSQDQVAWWG